VVAPRKVASPTQAALGPIGPIQIIPPGLLGLLQLKQLGRLPDKLSDLVAPVVELRDWYLTARRVDEFGLFGSSANLLLAGPSFSGISGFTLASGPIMAVPQNQIWWVEQFTIDVVLSGAADFIRFAPMIQSAAPSLTRQQTGPDVADVTTARTRVVSARSDRGFWAFPGDVFSAIVFDSANAAANTVHARLRATPCPI
jgi:hypothetical protein